MRWVRDVSACESPASRNPALQLAIDEAMLLASQGNLESDGQSDSTASGTPPSEWFRVWQFDHPTVVLGRSSKVDKEIDREFCRRNRISIQRRCSGGATILGGPGCLMYSLVLSFDKQPGLRKIDQAHDYVMDRVLVAVRRQVPAATRQGICDLAIPAITTAQSQGPPVQQESRYKKFSGNALRMGRSHLLYHGTILHDFDLDLLASCLDFAPRQPRYRNERPHDAFVTNVALDPDRLASDLAEQFQVQQDTLVDQFLRQAGKLKADRYDQDSWRFRH